MRTDLKKAEDEGRSAQTFVTALGVVFLLRSGRKSKQLESNNIDVHFCRIYSLRSPRDEA